MATEPTRRRVEAGQTVAVMGEGEGRRRFAVVRFALRVEYYPTEDRARPSSGAGARSATT